MTAEQFAYWLQGFAELQSTAPTQEQWQSIREHLQIVFKKVTQPIASPKMPEVKDNPIVKDMIERAKKEHWVEPPRQPYQPYFLGDDLKPGTIIC